MTRQSSAEQAARQAINAMISAGLPVPCNMFYGPVGHAMYLQMRSEREVMAWANALDVEYTEEWSGTINSARNDGSWFVERRAIARKVGWLTTYPDMIIRVRYEESRYLPPVAKGDAS